LEAIGQKTVAGVRAEALGRIPVVMARAHERPLLP